MNAYLIALFLEYLIVLILAHCVTRLEKERDAAKELFKRSCDFNDELIRELKHRDETILILKGFSKQ